MTKGQRPTTSPKACVIKVTIILRLMHKVYTIIYYLFNFSKNVDHFHSNHCILFVLFIAEKWDDITKEFKLQKD